MNRCWVCQGMRHSEDTRSVHLGPESDVHICEECWEAMQRKDYEQKLTLLMKTEVSSCH